MSYQQQDPYSNPHTYGSMQPPPKDKRSSGKMMAIMTGIIVPIVVALIGAGILTHNNSGPTNPTSVPTSPSPTSAPTTPLLHQSYSGSGVNVVTNVQFAMSMFNVSQQGESFSATMSVGPCNGRVINGTVTQDGRVTFVYTQEANFNTGCPVLNSSANGTINSSGTITGQWSSDAGGNGSFSLS